MLKRKYGDRSDWKRVIERKYARELEDALSNRIIDEHLYDLAWSEMKKLKSLIIENNFELLRLSNNHK